MHAPQNDMSVDVCVPTLNRVDLLLGLLQTIPSAWKIHISDNGGSVAASGRIHEDEIEISSSSEIVGLFPNWIRAAQMATAEWFFLPSDDDVYYPNAAAVVARALSLHPHVGMIVFGHNNIDENGRILDTWVPSTNAILNPEAAFKVFAHGVSARMPSVLIQRQAYLELGGISQAFELTAGDSELVQRIAMHYPVLFVPEVISGYRVWQGSFTHKKIASKQWSDEIELWLGMQSLHLLKQSWAQNACWIRKNQDEVRLQNILAGLVRLREWNEIRAFLGLKPYPWRATLSSHLLFLKIMLKKLLHK